MAQNDKDRDSWIEAVNKSKLVVNFYMHCTCIYHVMYHPLHVHVLSVVLSCTIISLISCICNYCGSCDCLLNYSCFRSGPTIQKVNFGSVINIPLEIS